MSTPITRVRYRERQLLRASDLNDEQAYHLSMRRRHNIGQHSWGIVSGLELAEVDDDGEGGIVLKPGMAVDGYGRELIVDEQLSLPVDTLDRVGVELIDVWLFYCLLAESAVSCEGYSASIERGKRWKEESRLRLTPAYGPVDPRSPGGVPASDLRFGPHNVTQGDPRGSWPVYLGRLSRTPQNPSRYSLVPVRRVYAGLVGESITAPTGSARVQIGMERTGDNKRFAVSVGDKKETVTERLSIDAGGDTTITGNSTLYVSDLHIARGARGPSRRIQFRPPAALRAVPSPWTIYRTVLPQANNTHINQLRFEITHPDDKADPGRYRTSIGYADKVNTFVPCFSVTADCAVRIHGKLVVEGQVLEGPIQADLADPRFGEVLLGSWVAGAVGAGNALEDYFAAALDLEANLNDVKYNDASPLPKTHPYSISVRNVGSYAITSVVIYETIVIDGALQSSKQLGDAIPIIYPSARKTINSSILVPAGAKEITLILSARATSPSGSKISKTTNKTVKAVSDQSTPGPIN